MTNGCSKVDRAVDALVKKELVNVGRWAKVTIKKTGETLTLVRTGYGPMEYPERDPHILKNSEGEILCEADDLIGIARYILDTYS